MTYDTQETSAYSGKPVECYRFTQGPTVWLYTSADLAIVLPTGTYQPAVISRGGQDLSQEDAGGSLEVHLARDNPVAALFIAFLPTTPVQLTVYRLHRGDTEVVTRFIGAVAAVRFEGSEAVLTCAAISQAFKRRIPALAYQTQCNWALYGVGCTVDRMAFRTTGVVTVVSGVDVTAAAFGGQASGWFTNGWLEDVLGAKRFIVNHVGSVVTLMNPLAGLAPGATVYAFAGCDRTEATCISKFNNLVNHLGWSRIPTKNPYVSRVD